MKFQSLKQNGKSAALPLYANRVPAGFPSPAADYIDKTIDLNELMIAHPAATYLVRVSGDSMTGIGIYEGSLLVVDSSLKPKHNDVVIANVSGEFTVKRFSTHPVPALKAENPNYSPVLIGKGDDLEIFGVVKFVINEV